MNILVVSLGCDKNLVDTEEMLGILRRKGHTFTDDESLAEIIIVNTCCFIHDAKEESIQTILEMAVQKEQGNCQKLIVTGCLAQRYQEEILKEIPEVDAILGTTSYEQIADVIEELSTNKNIIRFSDLKYLPAITENRIVTNGSYYAHLKIADGCNKHCTYCIIPSIRGPYRSIPMEDLIKQAELLAKQGVKELILVAQETTVYGIDLYGKKMLPELLKKLCQVEGLEWIRLLYCYPEEIDDTLIAVIKEEKKICHYLEMPIQHCSDSILRKMGRQTTKAKLIERIEKIRKEIPDITLRTTLISGFPGETREDYEELLAFVEQMRFERLGVFTYSQEEDTKAAEMPDQIEEELKEQRRDEIMALQQEIIFDKAENMIGKELSVMIEGKLVSEDVYVGRTYMDAPEIDGNIFIKTEEERMSGDFVQVKVTEALEYDLIGEIL